MIRKFKEEEYPWRNPIEVRSNIRIYEDAFPVTVGHLLFVPHVDSDTIIAECLAAAFHRGNWLIHSGECDDFNVGFNSGPAAGQTVKWPHVHLIPRHKGDVADPTGGIRGVIPSRQNYKTSKDYI